MNIPINKALHDDAIRQLNSIPFDVVSERRDLKFQTEQELRDVCTAEEQAQASEWCSGEWYDEIRILVNIYKDRLRKQRINAKLTVDLLSEMTGFNIIKMSVDESKVVGYKEGETKAITLTLKKQ